MRIKRFLTQLVICSVLVSLNTISPVNSNKQTIIIDNDNFHFYKNKNGKWITLYTIPQKLEVYIKDVGSTPEEVKEINQITELTSIKGDKAIFVPFGNEYMQKMLSFGKGRKVQILDKREMLWPVSGEDMGFISSRLGRRNGDMHQGIDIACPKGSPIIAAADGVIASSGLMGNYGNAVWIQHDEKNLQTLYAHNTVVFLSKGDIVRKGQVIGLSGSTGHSTGPHLHFEVRYEGIVLNPEDYFTSPKDVDTYSEIVLDNSF